jgi:hypothetical protein
LYGFFGPVITGLVIVFGKEYKRCGECGEFAAEFLQFKCVLPRNSVGVLSDIG